MKLSYLLTCLSFLLLFSTTEALAVVHRVTPEAAAESVEAGAAALSKKEQRKLERKEKREMRREFKSWFREMRATLADDLLLLVIIAILLPPLAMYLYEGSATNRFWISLVLWLLLYLPGLIYTLYVILSEN